VYLGLNFTFKIQPEKILTAVLVWEEKQWQYSSRDWKGRLTETLMPNKNKVILHYKWQYQRKHKTRNYNLTSVIKCQLLISSTS